MIITESKRDFRQKYRTCTVLVNILGGKQELLYVDDIDDEKKYILGSIITDNNDWSPTRWHVDDIEIDFRFPELGLLNAKKDIRGFEKTTIHKRYIFSQLFYC